MEEPLEVKYVIVKGVTFTIEAYPDYDESPDDYDCYTPQDKLAWEEEDWEFVNCKATPMLDGQVIVAAEKWFGVYPYGRLPDGNGWRGLDFILQEAIPRHSQEWLAKLEGELADLPGAVRSAPEPSKEK